MRAVIGSFNSLRKVVTAIRIAASAQRPRWRDTSCHRSSRVRSREFCVSANRYVRAPCPSPFLVCSRYLPHVARIAHHLSQTEIEYLDLVAGCEHDIFRFAVAMNDAASVRFSRTSATCVTNRERFGKSGRCRLSLAAKVSPLLHFRRLAELDRSIIFTKVLNTPTQTEA